MNDEAAALGRKAVQYAHKAAESLVRRGVADRPEDVAKALQKLVEKTGWGERNARLIFGAALFWEKAKARGLVGKQLDDELAAYRARVRSGEVGDSDTVVSD